MEKLYLTNNELNFSQFVDTSESLTVKTIICDFKPNENKVMLNRDKIESWIDTLINNPLLGKIGVTDSGKSDFEGHNYYEVTRLGSDGRVYNDSRFDTSAMGVFVDVGIEKISGSEYIVATAKVWKRFPEFCAVLRRRVAEGLLKSSWEIKVKDFHMEVINGENVKVIDDGEFIGHTLLGEHVLPAYKDVRVLEVASHEGIEDLINAIKKDINSIKEDTELKKDKQADNIDKSALTVKDIYDKIANAIKDKLKVERYDFYIIHYFPEEKEVWARLWDAESDLDIITFTYEIENDEVILSDPVNGKLSVSIAEINTVFSEMQEKIEKSNEAIIVCNDTIKELETQIVELSQYKEKFEKAEQDRIEAELEERRQALKEYALKSTHISKEEIESSEDIKNLINNVDEAGIKNIIADRVVASIKLKDSKDIKTSEQKAIITEVDDLPKYKTFIKDYIGGR